MTQKGGDMFKDDDNGVKPSLSPGTALGMLGSLLILCLMMTGCSRKDFSDALTPPAETSAPAVPAPPAPSTVLLAHWKLDGNAQDASGNAVNGTPVSSPTYERGVVGTQALTGFGSSSYLDFGTSLTSVLTTDRDWSVSFWFRTNVTETSFLECDGAFTLSLDSNGRLRFSKAYGDWTGARGQTMLPLNRWIHAVYVHHSDNTVEIYLNSNPETLTTNLTALSAGTSLWVGRTALGFLNGAMDDVRIYSGALNSGDVLQLFEAGPVSWWRLDESSGNPLDAMTAANDGTVYGAYQFISGGKFGGYASFGGTSEYIELPNAGNVISPSNPWTLAFWMRISDLTAEHHIIGNIGTWNIYRLANSTRLYFFSGAGTTAYINNPPFSVSTWAHVTVTGNGNTDTILMYIDGNPIPIGGGNYGSYSVSPSLYLGRFGSYYYTGDLDDVRVYKRVLTQAEIAEIMQ